MIAVVVWYLFVSVILTSPDGSKPVPTLAYPFHSKAECDAELADTPDEVQMQADMDGEMAKVQAFCQKVDFGPTKHVPADDEAVL